MVPWWPSTAASPHDGFENDRLDAGREESDGQEGDRGQGAQGARRAARRGGVTGDDRGAVRRGPERRLARPDGGRAGPRGRDGDRDPRRGDGEREDGGTGRRPRGLQAGGDGLTEAAEGGGGPRVVITG